MELRTITCDINTREEIISKEGSVVDAVMASTAIPGLLVHLLLTKAFMWMAGW